MLRTRYRPVGLPVQTVRCRLRESNTAGKVAKHRDLPSPVGKERKTSLPCRNSRTALSWSLVAAAYPRVRKACSMASFTSSTATPLASSLGISMIDARRTQLVIIRSDVSLSGNLIGQNGSVLQCQTFQLQEIAESLREKRIANHIRAVTFTNQNPWNGLHIAKIPKSPVTSPMPRVLTGGCDPPLCFTCCKDSAISYKYQTTFRAPLKMAAESGLVHDNDFGHIRESLLRLCLTSIYTATTKYRVTSGTFRICNKKVEISPIVARNVAV